MASISVRPVETPDELDAFLKMPYHIYKGDPTWVAPPWRDHQHYFDPAHNPELVDVDQQLFVAWNGDQAVGTIIAHVHHAYNKAQEATVGWFGQFELVNDPEVGHALLEAAETWVRAQGMTKLMGPATYSTNSEIGLLIDGYDAQHVFMTTYAKDYYRQFIENYGGFEKAMDIWSWLFNVQTQPFHERKRKIAQRVRQRRKLHVYHPNMRDWDKETDRIREIYHAAWSENWGFVPFSDAMYAQFVAEMKQIVDPDIVVMVESEHGKPIAFGAPIPNIYQAVKAANMKPDEPHLWQMLKLLWQWKVRRVVKSARIFLMGVVPEYRVSGVDLILLESMYDASKREGYDQIELSWVLETNDLMNGPIQTFGSKRYKTHRIYEKALSVPESG